MPSSGGGGGGGGAGEPDLGSDETSSAAAELAHHAPGKETADLQATNLQATASEAANSEVFLLVSIMAPLRREIQSWRTA